MEGIDRRDRPNEGKIFYEEKLMTDPRHDEVRRKLSHDGGQVSPRNEHY
ncbi:MAG: hypothetical protein JWM80_5395 [Cyanobacteria bacterium RYN_339]|nr:hypothetical protein [Cyanobacteria bacterium RYN_339]